MYPQLCSIRTNQIVDDLYFSAVAADFGLSSSHPGVILGEREGQLQVLVAPDGRTVLLPASAVRPGLREDVALALMDAVEEAIEDAREQGAPAAVVERLEQTLLLLDRCLGDEE